MKIRITKTVKELHLFRQKTMEVEETVFVYNIPDDTLFKLIKTIGELSTNSSNIISHMTEPQPQTPLGLLEVIKKDPPPSVP